MTRHEGGEGGTAMTRQVVQVPTVPFGKFKGYPLDQVPDQYLLWLGCLDDLREPLLGAVLGEMDRRLAADQHRIERSVNE